jgi:hypothetical protein
MPTGNHLLDAVPRQVLRAHQKSLEPVALMLKQILHQPGRNSLA